MTGAWGLASAAVAGAAHISGGLPCQDAAACRELPWGALLILADGAGSAAAAEQGAQAAIDGVVAWAERLEPSKPLREALAADALDAARDAVYARAESLGRPPADLASTLLIAALRSDGEALLVQLGDGALVIREAGAWKLGLAPARGEYANETFFVTSSDAHQRMSARIARDVDAAALCSDGLERLVIDAAMATPHVPFFDRAVAPIGHVGASETCARVLEELLSSGAAARLSDDDKSIAAAVKMSGAGASP